MTIPEANHPIWHILKGLILAAVLCFALSPYSGLYNSWKASDAITIIGTLAAYFGVTIPLDRLRASGNNNRDGA